MSYLKDELATHKDKQQVAAQKQETKAQRAGTKAEKRAEKQTAYVQVSLTQTFNRLNDNLKLTATALKKNNGKITLKVGGINTFKDTFKRSFALGIKEVDNLNISDIQNNAAYQQYKNTLSEQGFDVDVVETNRSADHIFETKSGAVTISSLSAVMLASGVLPLMAMGALYGAVSLQRLNKVNKLASNFTIKIKEKPQVALLEHKPVEQQSSTANLLDELNQQTVTAPQKKILEPIIK